MVIVAFIKKVRITRGDKMLSAKTIASYLISRSSELDENDLTNLKLQKILFYAQAESLRTTGSPIFKEEVEAWSFGPVVSSVYEWLKGCGAYPITTFDIQTDHSKLSEETRKFLNGVWEKYGKFSAAYLVTKTHEAGSPWAKTYGRQKKGIITPDSIATAKLQNEW